MPNIRTQPWLADALELLALRRGERVLLVTIPSPAQAAAVLRAVGSKGEVLGVEPDQARARAAVDRTGIEVLAYTPSGKEQFGTFDALGNSIASFTLPPGLPPSLNGLTLHHAFVVIELLPTLLHVVFASNAVALTLLP